MAKNGTLGVSNDLFVDANTLTKRYSKAWIISHRCYLASSGCSRRGVAEKVKQGLTNGWVMLNRRGGGRALPSRGLRPSILCRTMNLCHQDPKVGDLRRTHVPLPIHVRSNSLGDTAVHSGFSSLWCVCCVPHTHMEHWCLSRHHSGTMLYQLTPPGEYIRHKNLPSAPPVLCMLHLGLVRLCLNLRTLMFHVRTSLYRPSLSLRHDDYTPVGFCQSST